MLPFLSNVNYLASSNANDYIDTMADIVPKLSNDVIHYTSHRLRANSQFYAIDEIIQSMKTEPYIVYMVIDHNQKVTKIRFRKGQVY